MKTKEDLEKENKEMRELLKKCWGIIPIKSKKCNDIFLEVHNFLNK